MERDWLHPPSWRSAVVVATVPDGAKFVAYDLHGYAYYSDGRRIFVMRK